MTGRTTKGQRQDLIVDIGLGAATGFAAMLYVGFLFAAWRAGHGWVVLVTIAVAALVGKAIFYIEQGSDYYSFKR